MQTALYQMIFVHSMQTILLKFLSVTFGTKCSLICNRQKVSMEHFFSLQR